MTRTATGRLVWAILIALVVGWLTPGSAFAVSRSATSQVADDALHHAQTTYTALPESGPATAYDQFTTYDDVDRSHGPSPRSEAPTSATAYSYDHPALLVQFADVAGMTQEQVRRTNGDLSALGSAGVAANNGYVDVLSPGSRKHILDGDASGGGHRWPGAPDKSPYPKSWSDDQIIHNVGDIATDPGTVWRVQTGNGGIYTSSGRPAIWRAWEVRDGTRIRVAYEPATGRVVTAFPDTGPAKGAIVP